MSGERYLLLLRKVVVTLVVTLVTSVVGVLLNSLITSFANMLQNDSLSQFMSASSMTSYERQIYNNVVKREDIHDRLDNIGGLGDVKEDIRANILLPLKYPNVFFSQHSTILRPSRGILLYGPPGTGKTMLARAIAAEADVPFISLSLSVLENKYYGESTKLIQATFSLARRIQPCILFFDEIDGLMRQRSDLDQSAVYGFKTELLSQMDGMGSKADDSIFVIGTTNNLNSLDAAVKRRLPKVYHVKLPDEAERLQILRLKLADEVIASDLVAWVASMSESLSGSDLAELTRRASSFRLQDQCQDDRFQCLLERATCIEDVYPLMNLSYAHFRQAFEAMGRSVTLEQDEDDDEEEEEAPREVA